MTAASLAALLTAAAGLLSAIAAVVHSAGTRRQLAAHANSMEHAATGSTRPASPAAPRGE
jgi:biopolymer transport protein ExbB/TolQ